MKKTNSFSNRLRNSNWLIKDGQNNDIHTASQMVESPATEKKTRLTPKCIGPLTITGILFAILPSGEVKA